jgi:hypothetical protein
VFAEGRLAKREYERQVPAGKKTVKTPVVVVEIVLSRIVKPGQLGKADDAAVLSHGVNGREESDS